MLSASWKRKWTLALIATANLGVASCEKHPDAPDLNVKLRPYATDSRTQSIVRKNERISCSDPKFDGRQVYTDEEVQALMNRLTELSYQCEKWKK